MKNDDRIQATAEGFCRELAKYDEKRGGFGRYAHLCLTNALHRAARAEARERRRQARQVPFIEEIGGGDEA